MNKIPYKLHDFVMMKKAHPCQNRGNRWQTIRMGADIKIRCMSCGNIIMLTRSHFEKNLKKNLTEEENKKLDV